MRLRLAIIVGKFTHNFLKILKIGSGSTWPGHLALKIDPKIISKLEARLSGGSVLVTGTNGKTTTVAMIASILKADGFCVVHNQTSANLLSGIASSLILSTKINRLYPHFVDNSVGVFEVDEAYLAKAMGAFNPELLVLLNLSRDQLDRYGEIDLTVEKWRGALKKLKEKKVLTKIVYTKEDQYLQEVVKDFPKTQLFPILAEQENQLPEKPGFFTINASFAKKVSSLLNVSPAVANKAIGEFKPVFGRAEELIYKEKQVRIFLAKNPQSFDQNLQFLIKSKISPQTGVVIILNDNIPDGRDISWIYDIDSKLLCKALSEKKVYFSGKRAFDFALRAKYAGLNVDRNNIDLNIKKSLDKASLANQSVIVLPTYSAMLKVRKLITGKALL